MYQYVCRISILIFELRVAFFQCFFASFRRLHSSLTQFMCRRESNVTRNPEAVLPRGQAGSPGSPSPGCCSAGLKMKMIEDSKFGG